VAVTLVTHVRNKENIEKANISYGKIIYIDKEWDAAPMHEISVWLRSQNGVAWSTSQMMG